MVWGPPRGSVADVKKPNPGVAWLLERGFLSPVSQQSVVLHREVAIALRGKQIHRELEISPPEVIGKEVKAKSIQATAISNITTFLRWSEEVLNFWAQEPPVALKAGGVGVRDLRDLALHLGLSEECTSFIIEVNYLAGLLTIDPDDRILPTHQFDLWLGQSASRKWEMLVAPWLITSRMSGLVNRDGSKSVTPMGPELDRSNAAPIRTLVLNILQENSGITPEIQSLIAHAQWQRPYRRTGGIPPEYIEWITREAEWLGLTGQGALSSYGISLLSGEELDQVDTDLPKPVDHILIQSDNTAIAPGTLEH